MRTRLLIIFLVPLVGIMLALGGAYAWSASRNVQQEFTNQQLGDLSYFVTSARHALRASNSSIVESEMVRYSELYGAHIAVLDRAGVVWASGGLTPDTIDEDTSAKVALALSGRRSEVPQATLPWSFGNVVMVEPVFDDGSVIGAVLISASAEAQRQQIGAQWFLLIVVTVIVVALLVFVVWRLANWVLRPMQRVDHAMAAIEHGEMDARIDDDTGPPEMRRMIRLFNQMAEEIERMVSRQREFSANASHELRNPLGALLMRVEHLATGLDDSWQKDIEETREEGRRMSRILDTLLLMAKSSQHDSPFSAVDLVEVVEARVDAWRDVASQRGIDFEVRHSGHAMSMTDRTAVESALDAVLDNALKFSPRGTRIEATVDVVAAEAEATECVISVRDHGPGVDEHELAQMTERFWRSPRNQNVPGSGLGLAIATDLLDTLGGRVELQTADGGGLRVSLHLPGAAA